MTANDNKTTAMVPEDGTPRFKGIRSATGAELRTRSSRVRPDYIFGLNLNGSPVIDECWINTECAEIETSASLGKTRDLFRKVKEITGNFAPRI